MRKVNAATATLALLAALACASLARAEDAGPQIAITFDDLPVHGPLPAGQTRLAIAQQIIAALKGAGAPPTYGFVNAVQLTHEPDSVGALRAWRQAGFPLGNHTYSHADLNQEALDQYAAGISSNEAVLSELQPEGGWRWFRYPFLSEGTDAAKRDGVRAFLAAHGYRIAAVTMSFDDYAFNAPYARCLAKGDAGAIAQLEATYLDGAAKAAAASRTMARTLFGRDIPYVLLMHIGAFDARMAPRLMALYRAEGFSFVSLPQAEQDPFYRADIDPNQPAGPNTLQQAMYARGLAPPSAPVNLAMLDKVCA